MSDDIRILIPADVKAMFKEQLEVSSKGIQKYKNDTTPEGTEQFYHHAAMINNINTRIKILEEIQKKS